MGHFSVFCGMDVDLQTGSPLQSAHRPYVFVGFLKVFFVNAGLTLRVFTQHGTMRPAVSTDVQ